MYHGRVAALADAGHLPAENLLAPDAVRRLAWQPPEPLSPESVAGELQRYGARPWQIEMTAFEARSLARKLNKVARIIEPPKKRA